MVVMDTCAVSAVMHSDPDALHRLSQYAPRQVLLPSPVAAELHFGIERLPELTRRRRALMKAFKAFRDIVEWADWDAAAASEFGRQKAYLEASGQIVPDFDIAIGSVAVSRGARLATYNVKHFGRLKGIELDDWS